MAEKLPMDGLEGLCHDVNCTLLPVLMFVLIFMLGKSVSQGSWKLSHMIDPVVFSRSTRFPEFKSWALELATEFITFDDQRISFFPSSTTRFPSSDIVRTPEESLSGVSLLATHTTVHTEMLPYHIPM